MSGVTTGPPVAGTPTRSEACLQYHTREIMACIFHHNAARAGKYISVDQPRILRTTADARGAALTDGTHLVAHPEASKLTACRR